MSCVDMTEGLMIINAQNLPAAGMLAFSSLLRGRDFFHEDSPFGLIFSLILYQGRAVSRLFILEFTKKKLFSAQNKTDVIKGHMQMPFLDDPLNLF